MRRFLAHCLTTALALGVAAWVLPGVRVISISALFVAALVLGFVNTIVKPLLFLLTLPITVLTLGFFYLVVNGLAFALAAWVVPGFEVRSFGWARSSSGWAPCSSAASTAGPTSNLRCWPLHADAKNPQPGCAGRHADGDAELDHRCAGLFKHARI